jgi:peptidyl-tRNA hydrolase
MAISRDTFVLYGLCRTDMDSLNPGKLAAQAMHAQRMADIELVEQKAYGPKWLAAYRAWSKQSKQGYGYTLTLGVDGEEPLRAVTSFAKRAGFPAGVVLDDTYPLVDGKAVHFIPVYTVGWVFGAKGDVEPLLARFSLCP